MGDKSNKRKQCPKELNWSKKSIFYELEYWSSLSLKHNLDIMHIDKSICDNLLGKILGIERKSKDTDNARLNLEALKIMPK